MEGLGVFFLERGSGEAGDRGVLEVEWERDERELGGAKGEGNGLGDGGT